MTKIINLMLCIGIFASCTKSKNIAIYSSDIHNSKPTTHLEYYIVNDTSIFAYPTQIECIDSIIIVADNNQGNNLHIFDTTGKHLTSFCKQGKGPGEINSVERFSLINNGDIVVYDYSQMKVVIYDLKECLNGKIAFKEQQIKLNEFISNKNYFRVSDVQAFDNDCFFIRGSSSSLRYGFIKDSIVKPIYNAYPINLGIDNPEEVWSLFDNGDKLKFKPDLTKFVHTTVIGGIMQFFNVSKDKAIDNYENKYIYKPLYRVDTGAKPSWVISDENTTYGFFDVFVDNTYIYALLGANKPRENGGTSILMYDWNGELNKIYDTNQLLQIFCKGTGNTIYAIADRDGVFCLVKYTL